MAADRVESSWTRTSSSSNNNSQSRPSNTKTEASITRDRGTAATTGATTGAGHFGTTARGQLRRSSTASSQRRLGVFDSSSSRRRRRSTEGHLTGTPAGSGREGGAGTTSIRASFHLGGGPLSSSESDDTDAHTPAAAAAADNDNDTSDGVIYSRSGKRSRASGRGSKAGSSHHHHERSGSGDDALRLEPDGLDAYDTFRRAAQRDVAARRRTSTVMSTDDEGELDAPHLGDDSVPRINVNLSAGDIASHGGEKQQQEKEGQELGAGISRASSSAASGSSVDAGGTERRRVQRRRSSIELLNRNEAELMSEDFHYAEYLDMKQQHPSSSAGGRNTAAGSTSRSSLHSSKNSSYSHGSTINAASTRSRRSSTPVGGGYASTDDSAVSYRRTTIAHGGASKNNDSGLHQSSYSSATGTGTNNQRRESYPPPQHYESDSSGVGAHRPSATAWASSNTTSTPEEEGSDDADYGRGRSVEKRTKKDRKRLSDHTTVPPLELGNSCFEEGTLKGSGGNGSSDETDNGGKFARRFSGHSMASINLIMPQMDDSKPDTDGRRKQGNFRRKKANGRGSKDVEQSKAPPPDDDLNPRWQGSMTDLMHANSSSASRMRKSRSISPHRRHAIEDFNRSGNASTNFVETADAARRWSGSDDSGGSSPGTGTKSRLSSLSGSEGNATPMDKTRIHRGGLKGMWSLVVKGKTSSRSGRKSTPSSGGSKSKERQQRGYGIDSSETNSGSSRSFGRNTGGRESRKVKYKISDVETGRGVDNTDTGNLVGQGNLGDKMIVTGSKSRPTSTGNLPPSNMRRRIIFQSCTAIVLLILAFILPLILKVPGLVPPRTTEALEAKAKELLDRLSSAASSPFVSSGEQYDDLGRPVSGLSIEDATTLFAERIDDVRPQVPAPLHNLLDVDVPAPAEASGATVTPFLWHLDRSGSDVVEEVVAECLGQRVASDLAGNTKAQIYTTEAHLRVVSIEGGSYLNVDLSTMAGVDRGRDLGLLSSGLVDSVVSPQFFYAASQLFDAVHQGRVVCMFRDPVTRELENYQDLVDSIDQDISLEEYLREFDLQENLIVRTITGNEYEDVPVTAEMLERAKAIVRTKCLVGIYDQLAPSIARFEEYFGYGPIIDAPPSARPCIEGVRKNEERASRRMPKVEQDDPSYQTIMSRNEYDTELYTFAKVVWEEQGKTLFERQRGGKTFRTMRVPSTPGGGFRDHDVYGMNGH